jgi:FlaA1/EpsC-like NDP-sugar epimerase
MKNGVGMKKKVKRRLALFFSDGIQWIFTLYAAFILRLDFSIGNIQLSRLFLLSICLILSNFIIVLVKNKFFTRKVLGSFEEVIENSLVLVFVGSIGFSINYFSDFFLVPKSVPLIATFISLVISVLIRVFYRLNRDKFRGNDHTESVLIFGAGDLGGEIARSLKISKSKDFQPIGFLDDDPQKQQTSIAGVRVLGTSDDLEKIAKKHLVKVLIIAISDLRWVQSQRVKQLCDRLEIRVRIIPATNDLIKVNKKIEDLNDFSVEDLLGRSPLSMERQNIEHLLSHKKILITGAGGSIGSELSRQILSFNPSSIFFLDRDETLLHNLRLSMDKFNIELKNMILADIRDKKRIHQIFQDIKPNVIFHTAALKHVNFLELNPEEAFKTNVEGTRNLLEAARDNDVEIFVNVSTDKAANAKSVLGNSKFISEKLTAEYGFGEGRRFISVRFGNVLGSRGSALLTFKHQIENGGPITVRHPKLMRYFMTISEAINLVLQASVLGKNGELLVLDMGSPLSIDLLAKQMIKQSGKEIEIVYTELEPGEKLEEELFGVNEQEKGYTIHPRITHINIKEQDSHGS